jgi:hypothetical protein
MRLLGVGVAVFLVACGGSKRSETDVDAQPIVCMPDGINQCQGASWQTCMNGQWVTAVDCPEACADMLGCVQCQPGTNYCKDGNVVACDSTGTPGQIVQMCAGVDTCSNAQCVDACNDAAQNRSYIACEYWAVDLDNAIEVVTDARGDLLVPTAGSCAAFTASIPGLVPDTLPICIKTQGQFILTTGRCDPQAGGNTGCPAQYTCNPTQQACVLDAQHSPFAIVVSNPQARDTTVTVTGPGGQTITQTVAAGQVQAIMPQMSGAIPDQSVEYSQQAKHAYKVTSDLPIVAYQFNPLDNVNVFSNDASLLIPRTTFDVDYYAMSWPTLDRRSGSPSLQDYYGYVTIVAYADGTQIDVTPTAAVQASASLSTIAAGATQSFTLNSFDVLQLEASGPAGDLTGTHVTSPNMMPFGMFGGHMAASFGETTPPDSTHTRGPCCADHLEEMVFPKSTWGKQFAIARSQQRTNEPDYLRIMAQKPNTSVAFDPAPSAMVSGDCTMLQPGTFCDVKVQGDTEITATDPILIGHYLESSIWQNNQGAAVGNGDPSMAIAVPTEQYRTDYTILIPSAYAMNYVSISAALTGAVTVDGTSVTLSPFPSATPMHRVARVPLTAGQHTIHCPDTCGVLVYGYSDAVSYMFAGGLDLKQIVIQ